MQISTPADISAQVMAFSANSHDSTAPKLEIGIYADLYYGNNFTGDSLREVPYFVSAARNNELGINLAYAKIRFSTPRVRIRFAPALGTYMNANYAAEPGTLKNFLYANAGVKLSAQKDIWLTAGILESPYTNEGPVSFEQPLYTRSFAADYVPYYLCGIKLSLPLTATLHASCYLINGWQQIQDVNSKKSIGTQLEYRPSEKNLLNWNTYIGDERSAAAPDYRTRYFTDVYWIYNDAGMLTFTTCAYIGFQQMTGDQRTRKWWQLNAAARYRFNKTYSLSGRAEYFNDEENAMISPVTRPGSFTTASGSLCINMSITEHALLRLEARQFFSDQPLYRDNHAQPAKNNTWLTSSLAVSF